LNHGANERDTPARAYIFTDKANGRRSIPWQLASDDAEASSQEAITEEPDELLAFDHAERTAFGLEHAARRARDIEQESRELTDLMLHARTTNMARSGYRDSDELHVSSPMFTAAEKIVGTPSVARRPKLA
jgi:hypothetical protein